MREKKEVNIQIGKAVRAAREQAGLTQDQLGELLALGTKNISDIERGVTGITVSTLMKLCHKLSISSDTIIFGERPKSDAEFLAERLSCLPPDQFQAVKAFLEQTLLMFSRME